MLIGIGAFLLDGPHPTQRETDARVIAAKHNEVSFRLLSCGQEITSAPPDQPTAAIDPQSKLPGQQSFL